MAIGRLGAIGALTASLLIAQPALAEDHASNGKPETHEAAGDSQVEDGIKSTHDSAHSSLHVAPVIEGMVSMGGVVGAAHNPGIVSKIDVAAGVHMVEKGSRHSGSVLGGLSYLRAGEENEACVEGTGIYQLDLNNPNHLALYFSAIVGGCVEVGPKGTHIIPLVGGGFGIVIDDAVTLGVIAEGNPAKMETGAKVLGGIGVKFPLKSKANSQH